MENRRVQFLNLQRTRVLVIQDEKKSQVQFLKQMECLIIEQQQEQQLITESNQIQLTEKMTKITFILIFLENIKTMAQENVQVIENLMRYKFSEQEIQIISENLLWYKTTLGHLKRENTQLQLQIIVEKSLKFNKNIIQ
ncbi:Hypothetical_protein [Hexamita inflata]|uniref:Hypothetical_protein n=1 Tax=Hexamita inflata TaxID=28002 RepID=A0AA86V6J2_9EUKA|nr:Hypothetical protein HINF_LOCUS65867 [Hexamita inflata]